MDLILVRRQVRFSLLVVFIKPERGTADSEQNEHQVHVFTIMANDEHLEAYSAVCK
jgi:hypothetical protein